MLVQVVQLIEQKQRFMITSHIRPDGDGLGSGLALYWMLQSLGKEAGTGHRPFLAFLAAAVLVHEYAQDRFSENEKETSDGENDVKKAIDGP